MTTKIELLLSSAPQTTFTIDDLAVLWSMPERYKLVRLVNYYVRTGRLYSIRRGVYTLKEDYSPLEAAIKLSPPAYISSTTALGIHGAYFQYESDLHVMARSSKTIRLSSGQTFVYHRLKDEILLNRQGVEKVDNYWLASLERAICDTSYLTPSFVFEHLERVEVDELRRLASIYDNHALVKRIEALCAVIEGQNIREAHHA
ncbi:MAG: hypothetical protein FJ010_14975 [Chloroflexi bacterium]|nr:hypothetical protein [Chloroflexota bacterium]